MLNSKSFSKQYLFAYLNVTGSWHVRAVLPDFPWVSQQLSSSRGQLLLTLLCRWHSLKGSLMILLHLESAKI